MALAVKVNFAMEQAAESFCTKQCLELCVIFCTQTEQPFDGSLVVGQNHQCCHERGQASKPELATAVFQLHDLAPPLVHFNELWQIWGNLEIMSLLDDGIQVFVGHPGNKLLNQRQHCKQNVDHIKTNHTIFFRNRPEKHINYEWLMNVNDIPGQQKKH